jgi:hypothetical protein
MPRFVILRHELPAGGERGSHWDLMFEHGGSLRTWAAERLPEEGAETEALQLADHRLEYLNYEGLVSGDRGSVSRWDAGEYTLEVEAENRVVMTLAGSGLAGRMTFGRAGADQLWRVSFSAAPTSGCS